MEFLRLLEIDRSLLAPEAEKSLLLADRIWCEEGCPREPSRLVAVLEKILQRCLSSGLWYAPILLRRKKGLERGTWRPPACASCAGESPSLPATASPATRGKNDGDCATCGERESWFVGVDSQGLCAPAEPTYVASSKSRFSCVVALPQLTGHRNVASCHF